ncbi:MAG: triose-phosphate isomerase [Planctomycetota bacterium]
MRRHVVFGNWKMNTTTTGALELARAVAKGTAGTAVEVGVCPPFVYVSAVAQALKGSHVRVGAQDVYFEKEGAFTGEVSTAMLVDAGATHVIVGHSERRHVIGETDELINRKVASALAAGLSVIFCVGELLAEREAGRTQDVLSSQIVRGLAGLRLARGGGLIVAYEPVWAIGTGKTATARQAQEAHAFIRKLLAREHGGETAAKIPIQYGGSVKPENACELMREPDVDGALVGGASLKADAFVAIVEAAARAMRERKE